jgi:hypothetical protein
MYPFSYTSLKIIHDQKVQEALERQRFDAGQDTGQGLFRAFGAFLARFKKHSDRKSADPLPDCAWEAECTEFLERVKTDALSNVG